MSKKESDKKIISALLKASKIIHKASLRGSGNFILTSPEVSETIQNIWDEQKKRDDRIKKLKDLLGDV